MNPNYEQYYQKLSQFNQTHLLDYWDKLSGEQKCILVQQIENYDFVELIRMLNTAKQIACDKKDICQTNIEPLQETIYEKVAELSDQQLQVYRDLGLNAIKKGHVGVILMAGGLGTRLGSSLPKGMFDIGLESKKSLFQYQAERLLKLEQLAGCDNKVIPWYIMTSDQTDEITKQYFEQNQYFGLQKTNVVFFKQRSLPCFELGDKIIMKNRYEIATSPNGNGGLYNALVEHKIFEDFEKRGIEYVHVYCVDNVLIKIADPIFIGYALTKKSDCAAKVVEKIDPSEPVGVICRWNGQHHVIEYSEIGEELSTEKSTNSHRLVYNAANIANHYFTVKFLKNFSENLRKDLPIHPAFKTITAIDDNKVCGVKMEYFIFDIIPFSKNFSALQVVREHEFSPLKNSLQNPKDNAETCKRDLHNLHKFYLEKAGAIIVDNNLSNSVEISPLLSYDGENLEHLVRNKIFNTPVYLS